jgi:hypothetical protein
LKRNFPNIGINSVSAVKNNGRNAVFLPVTYLPGGLTHFVTGGSAVKEKKSFTRRIGDFIAGKGFYVVLLVCTAVIGISAWILLSAGNLKDTSEAENIAGVSQAGDEAMASPDSGIADALASDEAEARAEIPEESLKPSATPSASPSAKPSAAPKEDTQKKETAADSEESEEAMAKELVFVCRLWAISP